MLSIHRGDVIFVDLNGGVGVEKTKERPCLVVQNDRGNARAPFTIIIPITDGGAWKGYREQVQVPASELGAGGKPSVLSCGEVRQVDRSRINEARGIWATLPEARIRQVDQALRAALEL